MTARKEQTRDITPCFDDYEYCPEIPNAETALGQVGRRDFLGIAAAGITIWFSTDQFPLMGQEAGRTRPSYPTDFNAYLTIRPDGRVDCMVGKIEMGQGNSVALAQLAAEELCIPADRIDMIMGDTQRCPWDAGTWGSQSIRIFGNVLRAAAAEARETLIAIAAERLQVPADQLVTKDGLVHSREQPERRVTYAELAAGKRIERRPSGTPRVKPASELGVIGQSAPRRDAVEKVTGSARYTGDIRLAGLLHARILRPPVHGARLKTVDTTQITKVQGVRLLQEGDLVAVLHAHRDEAERALGLIKADWEVPAALVDDRTIFDHLLKAAPTSQLVGEKGDLQEGRKLAATVFDETYLNSYVAHACMETHSALAELKDGKFTLWVSTQTPFGIRGQVAQALGVEPSSVRVITPYVGGGFGGKSAGRQAAEAAWLAKLAGCPVQVVWSREEEFFYDTFRPAAVVKIRSGLDSAGHMVFWDFDVYCAGDREARQFYDIPHERTVSRGGWGGGGESLHPFGTGPWRAPAVNTNTFARESQIDTMAAKAGRDPLEFRLQHLTDPRMKRVLQAAADRFGWKSGKRPSGDGIGIACAMYLGTYVATVAQLRVAKDTGQVQVSRVVCAQDMGLVINPEGARTQIEGAVTMGLGSALTEEVRFKGGQVLEQNFDSYQIPRFSWLPEIDAVLIEAREEPAQGGGEPPIVCMGAVIANAIYDAIAVRVRQLPMTPARIVAALQVRSPDSAGPTS